MNIGDLTLSLTVINVIFYGLFFIFRDNDNGFDARYVIVIELDQLNRNLASFQLAKRKYSDVDNINNNNNNDNNRRVKNIRRASV